MPAVLEPQINPNLMWKMTGDERRQRFRALATELYGGWDGTEIARDMRKDPRTVRRWTSGETDIPRVVLVALGAMLAVKRAERAGLMV
jgi:hypothetical protein